MALDRLVLPLEQAVVELNISNLKIRIIEVNSVEFSLFVAEKVVDSFQTGLGVHEGDDGHDNQSHGDCDQVEDRDDSVHF